MPTSSVAPQKCGTHATGSLNGAHPSVEEGKVTKRSASAGAETAASGRSILKYLTAEISSCITSKELPRNIHVIFVIVVLTEGIKVFEFPFFGTKKCVQTPILSSE